MSSTELASRAAPVTTTMPATHRVENEVVTPAPVADESEPSPTRRVLRNILFTLAAVTLSFALFLAFGSALSEHAAQTHRFDHFRGKLALGTAPVGPVDKDGHLLALGTSIAVLRIPDLGLKAVVGEGTTSGVLQSGPGHLRSTVFPGGAGTSVVFGRAAAYGGPFGGISGLRIGARIIVTTGVGIETFRVVSVRHAGDKIPVLATKKARLTLVTATGPKFFPTGTVSVDADSTRAALPARAPAIRTVPASEQPLGIDTSTVWALVLWMQALAAVVVLGIWAWYRRSPAHAWLLGLAPLLFVATHVFRQLTLLIPNLT
jgi:sortase A